MKLAWNTTDTSQIPATSTLKIFLYLHFARKHLCCDVTKTADAQQRCGGISLFAILSPLYKDPCKFRKKKYKCPYSMRGDVKNVKFHWISKRPNLLRSLNGIIVGNPVRTSNPEGKHTRLETRIEGWKRHTNSLLKSYSQLSYTTIHRHPSTPIPHPSRH